MRARVALPSAGTIMDQLAGTARLLLWTAPGTLDDLKDARLFLELGLARRAAERASAADLAVLERCLEEHIHSLAQLENFLNKDMAFHRQIAVIAGNPIFPVIVEAMFDWLGEYYRKLVRLEGAENLTIAEHRRILEAIARRDGAAAEQAMRDHLTRANDLYRRLEGGLAAGGSA